MQQIEFRAMGSTILAAIDSDAPEAVAWSQEVPRWFAGWEGLLSRFRPQSEISALNRNPGRWAQVSAALLAVLRASLEAARATGGLVTPTLLAAVEAAGYDRDFDAGAWADQEAEPRREAPWLPAADAWARIELDERRQRVRLPADVRLDLGGVAKGWAADEIVRRLGQVAPTLIDAGGDIAISGPRADGTPWPIAVADPLRPDARLDLLLLSAGGVATSGRDYRRWRQGDSFAHHIIDPRTGAPARTDVLSATVVAPSAVAAEAAAKAALIRGGADGLAGLPATGASAGLLVREDGTVLRSQSWADYCWRT